MHPRLTIFRAFNHPTMTMLEEPPLLQGVTRWVFSPSGDIEIRSAFHF